MLYDKDESKLRNFKGFAASFISSVSNAHGHGPALVYFEKGSDGPKPPQMCFVDLLEHSLHSIEIFLQPGFEKDFPVKIVKSLVCDIVYLVMKSGQVHVYDQHSSLCIHLIEASHDQIFLGDQTMASEAMFISRGGMVGVLGLDASQLCGFLSDQLYNDRLALIYHKLFGMPCSLKVLGTEFIELVQTGKSEDAAAIYSTNVCGYFQSHLRRRACSLT